MFKRIVVHSLLFFSILLCASFAFAQAPTYTASTLYTGEARKQIGELDLDKDGNVYLVNRTDATILKIAPDSTATVVAGGGTTYNLIVPFILQSDTFPALEAALGIITNVAVNPSTGEAYLQIAKNTWKLTTDGQLKRFVGPVGTAALTAGNVLAGLGGPAADAVLPQPGGDGGAAIGPDGSVYLRTGASTAQVVKIDPQGVATLYAGTGDRGNTGDGGPATSAQIYGLGAIAADASGNLYLAEGENGIRKISPDGIITTVVNSAITKDVSVRKNEVVNGVDPLNVRFDDVLYITALPDGSIAFATITSSVIYQLATDGKVYTIAGDGTEGYAGDGGPATAAQFHDIWGLTSDSAGNIYVTEGISPRYVRKLTRDTPLAGGGDTGGGDTGGGDTGGGDTGTTVELPTGTRGPVALDLDTTAGDQSVLQTTSSPKAGDSVVIDLVAVSGAQGQTGFQVVLSFDTNQLEWSGFQAKDVFVAGAGLPPAVEDTTVTISVAILGGTATKDSGSLGQATFKVLDGFTGETRVKIQSASYDSPVEVGPGGAFVVIGGATAIPSDPVERSDFSGDGEVGFSDFITFAGAFGSSNTDSDFDARIDLNDNGSVDFADFIIFAQLFGETVSSGKPATKSLGYTGINTDASLALIPQASQADNEVTLSVQLANAEAISAYQLTLHYDTSALQLVRAETAQPSRLAQDMGVQPVALQTLSDNGGTILSDVFASPLQNEGTLLNLTFKVLHPEAINGIDIGNILIADTQGNINALHGTRLTDLNPLPKEFALNQNHPNPFNPETQIAYQLPQSGDVSLTIYNLLGQQVRQLVQGAQPAGFYRVSWNGQDAQGRAVASGVYFYRLKSDQFSQTRMMVLLK